ncbi:MAG: NfeD family protein, partial [Phycisphaerae bacterium]|nr:NfeD family protein [Phycisphaerae bacterium]
VGGPTFLFFGLRMMPHTPIGRMLVLSSDREEEREGDDEPPPRAAGVAALAAMVGQEGVVVTDLRPVGTIRIGEKRYDALSELGMIRAGTAVRVTGVEGTELRVRAV